MIRVYTNWTLGLLLVGLLSTRQVEALVLLVLTAPLWAEPFCRLMGRLGR